MRGAPFFWGATLAYDTSDSLWNLRPAGSWTYQPLEGGQDRVFLPMPASTNSEPPTIIPVAVPAPLGESRPTGKGPAGALASADSKLLFIIGIWRSGTSLIH